MDEFLTSTVAVMDALGGTKAVAQMTGREYNAAHNWRSFDTFPPDTYVVMQDELAKRAKSAPARLWRMVEPMQVAS